MILEISTNQLYYCEESSERSVRITHEDKEKIVLEMTDYDQGHSVTMTIGGAEATEMIRWLTQWRAST